MRSFTVPACRYLAALAGAAALVAGATLALSPGPAAADLTLFAILTAAAAVAHLYPIRSAREGTFYVVANVFVFAAVLLLPLPLLTLHCLLVMLPYTLGHFRQPRVWRRWTFNTAQTLLAAHITRLLVTLAGVGLFSGLQSLVVVVAAALVFPALQGLMVALMLHLNSRIRILDAPPLERDALLSEISMALIGAVVAALWAAQPWYFAVLPAPMIIMYVMMRRVQMVRMVDIDPKTGLYNYRYFEQALGQELTRSRGVRRPLAVMFMDLDFLRHVNNRFGHVAGDYVLKELAMVLDREARPGDVVARFGGEEFVAMLPGTDRAEATFLAEQLRRAVEAYPYVFENQPIRITMSIGVVAYPTDGDDATSLVRRADEMLYLAKAEGRNRVKVALSEEDLAPPADLRRPALTALPPVAAGANPERAAQSSAARVESGGTTAPSVEATGAARPLRPAWLTYSFPQLVAVAGSLTLAWVAATVSWPYSQTYLLGFMILAALVAELLTVHVYERNRQKISISMGVGAILGTLALSDLAGGLVVALTGALLHAVLARRRDWLKMAFNLGNICLSTVAAAAAYTLFPVQHATAINLNHLLGPTLAALTYFAVNTGLLSTVIAWRSNRGVLSVWMENLWFAPMLILSGLTGALLGATYGIIGPVGAAVFLVPILILRVFFSFYAQKMQKTIAELEKAKVQAERSRFEKEQTLDQLIVTISNIIDARDRAVAGHSQQVARYAVAIAEEMGLPSDLVQRVRVAALLHDLGKIGIPEAVLNKPARLTAEEYTVVQQHATLGAQILSGVPTLQDVSQMIAEHHERIDAAGYPAGKGGETISIGGRILAVADSLDSIISDRPYSEARSLAWALDELLRCAGEQFDPLVVGALVRLSRRPEHATLFVNSAQAFGVKAHALLGPEIVRLFKVPLRQTSVGS